MQNNINPSIFHQFNGNGIMPNNIAIGNFSNTSSTSANIGIAQVPLFNTVSQVSLQNGQFLQPILDAPLNYQVPIQTAALSLPHQSNLPVQSLPQDNNSSSLTESKSLPIINSSNDSKDNYSSDFNTSKLMNDRSKANDNYNKKVDSKPTTSSKSNSKNSLEINSNLPKTAPPATSSQEEYNKLPSNSNKVPSLYPPTTKLVSDNSLKISERVVPLDNPEDLVIISLPLTTNPFDTPKILQLPTRILCLLSIIDIAEITDHNVLFYYSFIYTFRNIMMLKKILLMNVQSMV